MRNGSRHEGRPVLEAAREGAASRLRAILMTAAAMIFGMLPMAIGIWRGRFAICAAGAGRDWRTDCFDVCYADYSAFDLRHSAKEGVDRLRHRLIRWIPGSRYYDAQYKYLARYSRCLLAPLRQLVCCAGAATFVPVVSKPISRTVELPGEFLPFLSVSLHAKVPGYVERVLVDRGSMVEAGDLLAELSAPEMAGADRRS